jgi:hypothetical protein
LTKSLTLGSVMSGPGILHWHCQVGRENEPERERERDGEKDVLLTIKKSERERV